MSFKTYVCEYTSNETLYSGGFDVNGNTLILTADSSSGVIVQYHCDPDISYFDNQATEESIYMTQAEFQELWPLLVMLLLAGAGVKYLIKVFNI